MKILAIFTLVFSMEISMEIAEANQVIGSVSKLRGDVSMLEVGFREAKKVVVGQSVTKEASILTTDKSFIQITLIDKTQVSLGPNSKMILDQTPTESVGLITLLKGKIRTEVIKNSETTNSTEKFFVKTRSAAMGVRGTNFETIYNPENNITNLITFRGQVALVKTEKLESVSANLHTALERKETVLVEKGTFAAISDNLKNATLPVKLSPVQYTGLKLNTEMSDESPVSKEDFQVELKKTIEEYAQISKQEQKQDNSAEHVYDAKNQVLRPTAGGVVDLETGIYVPPTIDKKNYNQELNIYELKSEKGEVTEAGTYIAPKGVILDASKGFIADPRNQKGEMHAELAKLNNDISGQIIKPSKPSKEDLGSKSEDAYDKYFIKE
jgi:hypothetical protein